MSCQTIYPEQIEAIVSLALYLDPQTTWTKPGFTPDEAGLDMAKTNAASVSARYGQEPTDWTGLALQLHRKRPSLVEALKLLESYEYNSCEAPGWAESHAKAHVVRMRSLFISRLPGYRDAPWTI